MSEPPPPPTLPLDTLAGIHIHGKTINNLPVACRSCPDRKTRDPLFPIVSPGKHFFLPCGHIQCRACITYQHAREARLESPLACSICRIHLSVAKEHIDIRIFMQNPNWMRNNRNMNIFYEQSPWYAAKEAFVLDKREYGQFFLAACRTVTAISETPDPTITTYELTHGVMYEALKDCVGDGLRMSCPELLVTELMIVFDDVVFDYMVRKESGPHHKWLGYFRTEDKKADLQKRTEFVKQLKKKYVHLRRLQEAWEEVMRQVASALVGKWSERFVEEKQRKR